MNYSVLPFLLIISFFSINLPFSVCADDAVEYGNCSQPISCGGVKSNISYPFWGENRPEYCGKSGFNATCQDGVPMITMKTITFRLLNMSNSTTTTAVPTVTVAREDYWNTLCPSKYINTDLDYSLFDYTSGTQNVSLYYGCNSTAAGGALSVIGFNYTSITHECSSTLTVSFLTEKQTAMLPDATAFGSCTNVVLVPVSAAAAERLDSNQTSTIQAAVNGGFELNVQNEDTGLCNNCVVSGGFCGQDTTTFQFICYCQNGTSATTCISNSAEDDTGLCNNCVASGGFCGQNTTTLEFICHCQDGNSATICDSNSAGSRSHGSHGPNGRIIGISVGVFSGAFLIVSCIIYILWKTMMFRKRDQRNELDIDAFIRNYGSIAPKRYSYPDVVKMTNSFEDQIGKGGYGTVYKGKLQDGLLVAVKVLNESKGDGEEFINEVASIGRTSHVNVVTLLGFCYQRNKRALIYEYMPNGSLDKFIYNQGSSEASCHLEWNTLSEIAVGVARGLEYLHRGCNTRILHFDIKPQNILLDKDFCPKIADFGLAKLCKTRESIVSMLGTRGTAGYIAPEVFSRNFGGVSHKSDVYSYGMLVLEMVGARRNLHCDVSRTSEMFPHYVYKDLELGNEESIFRAIPEEENETVRKMILVSLGCIQTMPSDRPSMSKVVEMLEGPLHCLTVPPKPFLFTPTESAINEHNISSDAEESMIQPEQSETW